MWSAANFVVLNLLLKSSSVLFLSNWDYLQDMSSLQSCYSYHSLCLDCMALGHLLSLRLSSNKKFQWFQMLAKVVRITSHPLASQLFWRLKIHPCQFFLLIVCHCCIAQWFSQRQKLSHCLWSPLVIENLSFANLERALYRKSFAHSLDQSSFS